MFNPLSLRERVRERGMFVTMNETCIFCKIINGEIPSYKIWEDESTLAFLTINPVKKGHVLLIPKIHEDYFFDLDDDNIKELAVKSKPIANAIKKAFKPRSGKVAMVLMGMGVPHVHLHLIPLDKESDINPENAYHASEEELKEVEAEMKAAL